LSNEKIIISIEEKEICKVLSKIMHNKFASINNISAAISKNGIIGESTIIFHKSILESSVKVGKHVIINWEMV
jgi:UDP-3-O-[3-hydroxymyristoyl] glucosamine N-acyltransferase